MTVSRTSAAEAFSATGSVVACVTSLTADSGPSTSTSAGSTTTRRSSYPGAGSPVTGATTGTFLTTCRSKTSGTVAGPA